MRSTRPRRKSEWSTFSLRFTGAKRALAHLAKPQRNALKYAYAHAEGLVLNLDALWAKWPQTLIECGLGKHLGALPVHILTQVTEISKSLPVSADAA
jgi:hypothetical protein